MIPVDFNRHVFRFLPQPAKRIRKTHNKLPHRRNNFLSCCRFILADKGQIIRIFPFTKGIARLAESIRKKLFPLGSCTDSENRINSCQLEFLTDSLCAGHTDERGFKGDPDGSWGWALENGATMIQTDRPVELIKYLESKGRRNL